MDALKETLKKLIDLIDQLPWIAKLILCIPAIDIIWSLYRVSRSIVAGNTVNIVISVVLCFIPFMWLVDLIFLLVNKKNIWTLD